MTTAPQLISWFRDDPFPPQLSSSALVIGGTNLMHGFMDSLAAQGEPGDFAIAVPFVDSDVIDSCPAWGRLNHSAIELSVVVRRRSDANAALRLLSPLPWRSLRISRLRSLHSKVFTFTGDSGSAFGLIGSHNLTRGGVSDNHETGVMIRALTPSGTSSAILDLHLKTKCLMRRAISVFDSTKWTPSTHTKDDNHE